MHAFGYVIAKLLILFFCISMYLGPRASSNSSQQSMMLGHHRRGEPSSASSRKGTAMEQYLKISSEMASAEENIINRLRREAADRGLGGDGYVSPLDPEFFGDDDNSESHRLSQGGGQRKRSYNLGRLDENNMSSARPVTQRSISKELYELPDIRGSSALHHRPVTRRSVSRELFSDSGSHAGFNPSWAPTSPSGGPGEFARSSRERSLGRDSVDAALADVERRINHHRRSESLSRPSLASQGRSLTQSELGMPGTSTSSSRRMSSGLRSPVTVVQDDDFLSSRLGASNRFATLDDRSRSDWRRVSVPERGKDFHNLSKKYNR